MVNTIELEDEGEDVEGGSDWVLGGDAVYIMCVVYSRGGVSYLLVNSVPFFQLGYPL